MTTDLTDYRDFSLALLGLSRKLATMTRKFVPENKKNNFFGINFLVILDNFCSINSSLLPNIARFMFFEHGTHGINEIFRSFWALCVFRVQN